MLTGFYGGPFTAATGGVQIAAYRPASTGLSETDPSNICSGIAQVTPGAYTTFSMENPTTVSATPDVGAYVAFGTMKDIEGNTIELMASEIVRVRLFASSVTPPSADMNVWAVVTAGALSSTSKGFGVELRASAGTWQVRCLRNNGTSWASAAGTADASTQGGEAWGIIGSSTNTAIVGAVALDGTGTILSSNVHTGNSNNTSQGTPYTHFTIGSGWVTGTGGSATDVTISGMVIGLSTQSISEGSA